MMLHDVKNIYAQSVFVFHTSFLFRRAELRTYWDYKQASEPYQQACQQLHSQAFPLWPRSDRDLLLFC